MRTFLGIGRWILSGALLASVGCQDTTAFRDYQCSVAGAASASNSTDTVTPYTISDAAWDETAVRQVLHVFALGVFASDSQITAWADMSPGDAIAQMLTFDTVNGRLSSNTGDTPEIARSNGTLRCLCGLFSVASQDNPVPSDERAGFRVDEYDAVARTWATAARVRGLNPVRQRIGFFETNYHLAISSNSGVTNRQMAAYYDGIMNDLARNLPYEVVLTNASLTAAVARQYNHRNNVYVDGKFSGNEDFGREYHQLFFGILGDYDDAFVGAMADYHELVTIPNTARALTDMRVPDDVETSDTIRLGTAEHWQGTLDILQVANTGSNARERFDQLAPTTIAHPESLANLPVNMIRMLADDLLDPSSSDPGVLERVATVRAIWAGMPQKSLLEFLRKYAISSAFHHPGRVKFWTSIERNLLVDNLTTLTNREVYTDVYSPRSWMSNEDVAIFRPSHDVFGGQTGLEAANTADVFRNAYNRSVESYWSLTRVSVDRNGLPYWRKDWGEVVPRGDQGEFRVRTTAEWLWQRYMADGLANFGPIERAHLYAILASGTDLAYWLDPEASDAIVTLAQIQDPGPIHNTIFGAESAVVRLDSSDADEREEANRRVSLAANFIVATPFFMAQRGR